MSDVDLHAALHRHFNFPAFRPGQEAALQSVLGGRHTLVVMPTGSGKSLIYQLAALQLSGVTLVVSPLIALMKDQVDSLTRRSIAATFINSTLATSEQAHRLRALSEGRFKIVLVAPERLRSRAFRETLNRTPISLLTVDEAHCLSQWGHDFRPDYLHIAEARGQFKAPVTLALTATATPRVQDDIIRLLGLEQAARIITGFNRPNLTLEVFSTPNVKAKLNFLRDFLAQVDGAGIIYTGTRRDAEEVADFVREVARVEVAFYHGGLDPGTRTRVQDAFMAGDLPIVVATNAFGMGIDRPDVRFVLHHAVPGTLEAYYQEAGRAGRDGLPARAILLYSPKDTALQEFFIENDSPSFDELRAVYDYLRRQPAARFDDLERATGLPQIKARVAVEQLEIAQVLRREPDEAFGLMRVAVAPWSVQDVQAVAAQVLARREHKYRQLEVMVDYAETNACRRRSILQHFGDRGPADAPLCCDNCLSQTEAVETPRPQSDLSQSERAALIVLDTLKCLKWPIGKTKLAQLLKGSAAKDMQRFEYEQARNYGKFTALKRYEIEVLIDQLIESGYVKQVGSERPTLKLTPRGETALHTKAAIRVELRHITPGETRRVKTEKEAGGTLALTEQLLARGLTPERIAAERGLTVGTIYSHLAQLIMQGKVDVNSVVPAEVLRQIRAAIDTVGSAQYLAPIKQRLPEDIDYNVIRCVANAWLIEHGKAPVTTQRNDDQELAAQVCEWGESGRQEHIPDLIAALNSDNGNVRRLAASALGKLKAAEAVEPLLALLEREPGPQVRQYAIKALGSIGAERARPTLEHIAEDADEMDYNRAAAKVALNQHCSQTAIAIEKSRTVQTEAVRDLPFEPLRRWRHAQAAARNLPDWALFGDGALRQLAQRRPRAIPELRGISGLSAEILEQCGHDLISVINEATSTEVVDAILECVRHLPGELPRSGVAKLLVGSASERVEKYRTHPLYDRLAGHSRTDVTMQVDALLESGRLAQDQHGHITRVDRLPVLSHDQPHQPSGQTTGQHTAAFPVDPVAAFLARPHPRPLKGPWLAGWALDFHSRFDGDANSRSLIGDLVFRYKYGQEHQLAQELAQRWYHLLAEHPELPRFDAVVPVPPSLQRASDPMTMLAQALAAQMQIPAWTSVLIKIRATRPQKEMTSLAQKRANVAGAFALKSEVRGKRVILVDDLYDSGATLEEAARVLAGGGASSIVVLTLTKTIHSDA